MPIGSAFPNVSGNNKLTTPAEILTKPKTVPGNQLTKFCNPIKKGVRAEANLAPVELSPKADPLISVGNNSQLQIHTEAKLPVIHVFPKNENTRFKTTKGCFKFLLSQRFFAISNVTVAIRHEKPAKKKQ